MKRILLLDLDGVLLESSGYHETLRQSVNRIAESLGFRDVWVSQEAIDRFEAAGLTSEWDSAAICAALLLDRAWSADPQFSLPPEPPLPTAAAHGLEPPDFDSFATAVLAGGSTGVPPMLRAECLILNANARPARQTDTLRHLLREACPLHTSLTFRLIQELNLGSATFEAAHGLPAVLNCESLLRAHDRAGLSGAAVSRLREWLREDEHHAVVFSNRPSRPPDGSAGPPEAEIGVEAAGVEFLPMVAMGGLAWLSSRRGLEPEAFLKPSPVHALTALLVALGRGLVPALESAASLAVDGKDDGAWGVLCRAMVHVFEDAAKGLHSMQTAARHLARIGVPMEVVSVGVAESPSKQRALEMAGAQVYSHLGPALNSVVGTG